MESYGLTMTGKLIVEKVSTLPAWEASDEGREVYVEDENKRYYGTNAAWVSHKSGTLGIDTGEITVPTGGGLDVALGSASGDDFSVDTDKLVVEGDTGNVGIGTTSPDTPLDVHGAATVTGILSVDDVTDSSSTVTGSIHTDGGLGVAKKAFFGDDVSLGETVLSTRSITVATSGGLDVALGSASGDDFSVNTDSLVVAGNTGYVGINIASSLLGYPYWQFHSIGNAVIQGTLGLMFTSDWTPNERFTIYSPNSNGDTTAMAFQNGTYTGAKIEMVMESANNDVGLAFYTRNATVGDGLADEFMRIDHEGKVGINTTTPSATLTVNGSISKTSGSFDIQHPDPEKKAEGWRLKHCFVESPTRGDNIYRYSVTVVDGTATVTLPDYYKFLNENSQVWCNPDEHFGVAYGKVNEEQTILTITANADGIYNIMLMGTRKDEDAVNFFDEDGVEYQTENSVSRLLETVTKDDQYVEVTKKDAQEEYDEVEIEAVEETVVENVMDEKDGKLKSKSKKVKSEVERPTGKKLWRVKDGFKFDKTDGKFYRKKTLKDFNGKGKDKGKHK